MTLVSPEIKQREIESPLQVRLIDRYDEKMFTEWLQMRQTFVEAQGWRYGDDADVYDADEATLHIVSLKEQEIAAGLRLTPANAPSGTLSWSMLSPAMQQEARERLPIDDPTSIWDLTRLVVGGEINKETAGDAFLEMLGAGMALSQKASGAPRWYFTTTYPLFLFFKQHGVEFTPLTKGKISESDRFESVFCYANPMDRTEWLRDSPSHRSNYEAVMRGVATVEQGSV